MHLQNCLYQGLYPTSGTNPDNGMRLKNKRYDNKIVYR